MTERPLVGIGVLVVKDGKILLGKRRNSHGAGEYASPGGHLEHLESIAACAAREVREECGIEIGPARFLRVLEVTRYAPKHYIDIAVVADWVSGEPRTLEPDKVDGWAWYPVDALPSPLFDTLPSAIAALVAQRCVATGELAIYFASAVRGGASFGKLASRIESLSVLGHVLTEHMASPRTIDLGDDATIHAHDQALLARAHVVIAEVTAPSTGTGYMIARAIARGIPVLCLHERGQAISAMIAGSPDVTVAAYTDELDFLRAVRAFLLANAAVLGPTRCPRIFLAGPPGSGKGTLGARLAELTGAPQISTGELLRARLHERPDDPLTKEIARYMNAGELVPATIMRDLVVARLAQPDCRLFGLVLDGYPPSLDDLANLREAGIAPDIVFYCDVSDATAIARQVGRNARATDNPETARRRVEVFRASGADYDALATRWYPDRLVVRLDAERDIATVEQAALTALRDRFAGARHTRSYFALPPVGPTRSTRVHFHVDARDREAIRDIAYEIHVRHKPAQGQVKIYPIDALALGPQHPALPIYAQLPNFHAIPSGRAEAFITGRLGDGDRALMQVALEVGRDHHAMVELEEYVGEWTLRADGAIVADAEYTLGDEAEHAYPELDAARCHDIPRWELHHGFDVDKVEHPELPIALPDLIAACHDAGLDNGGWFVFANDKHWAYRCNEFADGELAAARERLVGQAKALRAVLAARGLASAVGFSLERVHGIWVFSTEALPEQTRSLALT